LGRFVAQTIEKFADHLREGFRCIGERSVACVLEYLDATYLTELQVPIVPRTRDEK
jgi:hypothetical protein